MTRLTAALRITAGHYGTQNQSRRGIKRADNIPDDITMEEVLRRLRQICASADDDRGPVPWIQRLIHNRVQPAQVPADTIPGGRRHLRGEDGTSRIPEDARRERMIEKIRRDAEGM